MNEIKLFIESIQYVGLNNPITCFI